ncbi:Syntaxin-5 [Balamuthia mandrillaris]
MSFKDRTLEFVQVVETLGRKRQGPGPGTAVTSHVRLPLLNKPSSAEAVSSVPKSQFTMVAGQIGRQIHETSNKLSKLTKLARNTSLFDDKSVEIQQLTCVIKQDITTLNQQIDALQNFVRSQKTLRKNKQTENHTTNIVSSLKSKLASTTKQFQSVLETRTKNLKVQQEKRQQFEGFNKGGSSLFALSPTRPHSVGGESFQHRPLLFGGADESSREEGREDVAISIPTGGAIVPHQQQQQQSLLASQDSYLASRAEAVESIEQTIVELQGIFVQLANIVAEQGEMMQRIDANIDHTLVNVNSAQDELLKYLRSISGNRALIVKMFLVLVVFIILFVAFFA